MGDYGIFTEGHAHSDGAEHDEPAVAVLEDSDGKIGRPSFGDLGPADSAWQRLADAVAEAAQEHDRQTDNLLDAEQRFSETAARLDAALKTLSAEVKRLERRGAGEDVGA